MIDGTCPLCGAMVRIDRAMWQDTMGTHYRRHCTRCRWDRVISARRHGTLLQDLIAEHQEALDKLFMAGVCGCGCGEELAGTYQRWIWGHGKAWAERICQEKEKTA